MSNQLNLNLPAEDITTRDVFLDPSRRPKIQANITMDLITAQKILAEVDNVNRDKMERLVMYASHASFFKDGEEIDVEGQNVRIVAGGCHFVACTKHTDDVLITDLLPTQQLVEMAARQKAVLGLK